MSSIMSQGCWGAWILLLLRVGNQDLGLKVLTFTIFSLQSTSSGIGSCATLEFLSEWRLVSHRVVGTSIIPNPDSWDPHLFHNLLLEAHCDILNVNLMRFRATMETSL